MAWLANMFTEENLRGLPSTISLLPSLLEQRLAFVAEVAAEKVASYLRYYAFSIYQAAVLSSTASTSQHSQGKKSAVG